MNILVLGGTGVMGSYLVSLLNAKNHCVYVTTRTYKENYENIVYILGNAHDIFFLNTLLKKEWDCIIDFMVYTTAEFCTRIGPILKATKQYIFLSSAMVYANSKYPLTEQSPRLLDVIQDKSYLQTDEYALAKARQENILFKHKNKNWTIVRPYITYSERRLQLGVLEKEEWLYVALLCNTLLFSKDIAAHTTTLTYGYNVAEAIVALLGQTQAYGEVFHITSPYSLKWIDVFNIYKNVFEENNLNVETVLKEKTYRLNSSDKFQVIYDRYFDRIFDNTKISQFIDVSKFINPQDGLKKCLNIFLQNPVFDGGGGGKNYKGYKDNNTDRKITGIKTENQIPTYQNTFVVKTAYRVIKRIIEKYTNVFKKQIPVNIPILQGNLLQNKTALITGGTTGIGFAIAKLFLENGATVVITGRNKEKLNMACKILGSKNIFGIQLDNSDVTSFNMKFNEILSYLGTKKLDILVNNAGIIQGGSYYNEVKEADFERVISTNMKGVYFLSQIVSSYMKKNKIRGNILNIASSSSLRPALSPYSISKWALRGFTLGLAKALIPYGIVVNGLAPGPTATPLLVKDGYNGIELPTSPAGRYATAEEIANVAMILVSSIGRMIVGDIVYMTGGAGLLTFDDMKYE
ncbi:SDR family NAD(P)-dependent oxidoreductase [Treponema pedis]|uniref:SDR family NAD(P)-dependent oxidoreductase n=1 Tax=Treponema pedis TaxID=409322 RepID=UPI003D19F5B8